MATFTVPDLQQHVAPTEKIIKARHYRQFIESGDLLEVLKKDITDVEEGKARIYQVQHEAGFKAGQEEAKQRQMEQILETSGEVIEYLSTVEGAIVKIVFDTIRRVFSQFDDSELIVQMVRQGLQQFYDQKRIKVFVSSNSSASLRKKVKQKLGETTDLSMINIVESPHIKKGSCRLESEMGTVDCNMETFVDTMETSVYSLFRRD